MQKKDLKTGMLVQYRNGEVRMCINDYFVGIHSYIQINNYNNDLTHIGKYNYEFNIVKVSYVLKNNFITPNYWTEETLNNHLLWEREEETNELTIEEIEKLTGLKNIKIKK